MTIANRKNLFIGIPLVIAACSSAQSDGNLVPPAKSSAPSGPQPDFGQLIQQQEPPPPISGGTLAVSHTQSLAVAADSDRDRVYVVDISNRAIRHSIQLAPKSEPGRVALDNANRAHVALRGTGELATIDLATGSVSLRAACVAPRGVTFDAKNDSILVACASGDLLTFSAIGGSPKDRKSLGRDLRDVVLANDRIVATRFRNAHIVKLGADGLTEADETVNKREHTNLAWRAVAVPPEGDTRQVTPPPEGQGETTAVVAQDPAPLPVRAEAGGYGDVGMSKDLSCPSVGIVSTRLFLLGTESSVRLPSAVLPVDLATNGREFAVVAAGNAHTKQLPQIFIVHRSQLQQGEQECVTTVDGNVDGQAVAAAFDNTDQLIVQTREPAALHIMTEDRKRSWKTIVLAPESKEDTGHAIFHANAGGNIACASCHAEGADDGRTWDFVEMGPRRTPSLLGTTPHTEPFHWSGDMADLNMLVDHVFVERMSGPKIDHKQVDTLGNFIFKLPAPPKLRKEGDAPIKGRELFEKRCVSCHSGSLLTNNVSVDIGTGGKFQVPSLIGIAWRAPYLHTGCAQTLFDRFEPGCGGAAHGDTLDLDKAQIADLVGYLETL